ncbi:ABC transporter ATP-binding protein [Candidatus Mycoplasma haematobovis]|uniref:ABC transporter ATP-binding protein n=1 Tax=Candidatus Mycoplasma haematobovis TaxID=432608 RepID=A0A1A9QFK4_9MOLU|nr:cysteine peptidase family C39 domain-containing protein [Candidatus Mycoplasma haematobovis]OAL10726.1 ABC transporter ATP-binding protein [Candidatus Mycoplasma haematobovis]
MKVYPQNNENDCGISVTQSLIKHYYGKEISREELCSKSNLTEEGLSILDLEMLNQEYGIQLTAYEMDYEEFTNYLTNDYFLLLIKSGHLNHYAIAKKNKKEVIIFDSAKGKLKLKYESFKEYYLNIFITIEANGKKNKLIAQIQKEENFHDYEKTAISAFLNIAIFSLTLIISFATKYSINHIVNNYPLIKLGGIGLILIASYAIVNFGEYLQKQINLNHINYYSKSLFQSLINAFKNKKNSFFQKAGKDQFLLIQKHIENIATYHTEQLNQWIISLVILITLSIFLTSLHHYFLLIIFISFVIQAFYLWIMKEEHKYNFPKLIEAQNTNKRNNFELEEFLKNEINLVKLSAICHQFKESWFKEITLNKSITLRQAFFEKINTFFNNLIQLTLYFLLAYFFFTNTLDFSYFVVINVFYAHINKSFNNLVNYYFFRYPYQYSKKIYLNLLNTDTVEETEEWKLPNSIQINKLNYYSSSKNIFNNLTLSLLPNTFLFGSSGIGKTTLYKLISNKLPIQGNQINFDNGISINKKEFSENVIYQSSNSWLGEINIAKSIRSLTARDKAKILGICKDMKLDENIKVEGLSAGQKQLLNLLNLIPFKNKIILLDEAISHINYISKEKILKSIFPIIMKRNFVVCSEHCQELKKYFKNFINLNELLQ